MMNTVVLGNGDVFQWTIDPELHPNRNIRVILSEQLEDVVKECGFLCDNPVPPSLHGITAAWFGQICVWLAKSSQIEAACLNQPQL